MQQKMVVGRHFSHQSVRKTSKMAFHMFLLEQEAVWEVLGRLLEALGRAFGFSLRDFGRSLGGLRGIFGRSGSALECFVDRFSGAVVNFVRFWHVLRSMRSLEKTKHFGSWRMVQNSAWQEHGETMFRYPPIFA